MFIYERADAEVTEYFTSSLGVRAQDIDPTPRDVAGDGGGDIAETLLRMARIGRAIDASQWRGTLRTVYAPRRWPTRTGALLKLGEEPVDLAERLMFRPAHGHGCYVGLAIRDEAFVRRYEERHPERAPFEMPTDQALVDFLAEEARRSNAARFLDKLLKRCERIRCEALAAYATARRQLAAEARAEREARRRAALDEAARRRAGVA